MTTDHNTLNRTLIGRRRLYLGSCIAAFVVGCSNQHAVVPRDGGRPLLEDARLLSQEYLAKSQGAAIRARERDVLGRLAELWLRVDRPDEAINMAALHDRLCDMPGSNPIAERIATYFVHHGNVDKAIALGDSFPAERLRILVAIARAQTERGDYGNVEKTIELIPGLDRSEAWRESAVAAANRGNIAAAKEELGHLVAAERIHPLIAIGSAMLRAGNRDQGLACFTEARTLIMTPGVWSMWSSRNMCCQWLVDALLGGDEFPLALDICNIAPRDAQFRVVMLEYMVMRCADDVSRLNRVRDMLEQIKGAAEADGALQHLDGLVAACLARRGDEARALQMLKHLSPRERQPCLAILVDAACARNDVNGAIALARLVEEDPLEFVQLLGDASHYLHTLGNVKGADRILRVASATVRSHEGSEGKNASLLEFWAITLARCGRWQESDAALAETRQDVRGHALATRHIAGLRAGKQPPTVVEHWLIALNSDLDKVYGYLGAAEACIERFDARDRTVARGSCMSKEEPKRDGYAYDKGTGWR